MTGNEHFIAAESALAEMDGVVLSAAETIAWAQLHATLALVWAFNRMQTEAHGLQQYMADRLIEIAEAAEVTSCT